VTEALPRLTYVVGRLDRVLRQQIDESLRPHRLTTSQYTTLSILRSPGALSNAQLARRALITPQSMSQILGGLEAKGLIAKKPDPDHGRIIRVGLTAAGEEVLAACDRAIGEIEQRMLGTLGGRERTELKTALTACVRALGGGL
jgi:DNA-binding MarR family transcriptional regulator